MTKQPALITALVLIAITVVVAVVSVQIGGSTHHRAGKLKALLRRSRPEAGSFSAGRPVVNRPAVHPAANQRQSATAGITVAVGEFARSYAAYLDGGPVRALAAASITASAQAHQAGQIPKGLRDGRLQIASESPLEATCCSAQQTVVLADRQEQYPFTVTLLDDGPHGWQIAGLVPVDLSIDRTAHPARGYALSRDARIAARVFAVSYAEYKAGVGPTPRAMTEAVRAAIADGQDSLAGQRLAHRPVVLERISFGPRSGGEFAATATVTAGSVTETFSFLMTLTAGRWVAAAFL